VYESNFYQKLKSQTIEVLHHYFWKKDPTNPLGKKGKFKKEIVKLITLGITNSTTKMKEVRGR
jgi:hypothetical protein